MERAAPVVFVTTPTSGTGSLWRIVNHIVGKQYTTYKIAEKWSVEGRRAELVDWQPDGENIVYLYNVPTVWNPEFAFDKCRVISNFRDPRDLCCNQYYWALQHPSTRPAEQVERYRVSVRKMGLERFALQQNNLEHYKPFFAIHERLSQFSDATLLRLSYNQLCLDIEEVGRKIGAFLGITDQKIIDEAIALEKPDTLASNPNWIGHQWEGSDTAPGRHRREMSEKGIAALTEKYAHILSMLRDLDEPKHSHFYD